MKRILKCVLVFLAASSLLVFGTCGALGIGWQSFWEQRLLVGVVGGFGFLLTVLILLLLRFLELPEVLQSRGAGVLLSILFPVTEAFFLFFNRKKELGMPPRREKPPVEEPIWHQETFGDF